MNTGIIKKTTEKSTLLLVDDDASFHKLITSDFDTFNVQSAYDASGALRQLKTPEKIKLAVIDLSFDSGYTFGGIDLIKDIHRQFPDLPIIAVSKYSTTNTQKSRVLLSKLAIKVGAKTFLSKVDYTISGWEKLFHKTILKGQKPKQNSVRATK